MLASAPESTYSVEQAEQLLGNLRLSDSESTWLDIGIKEVTVDKASSGNVILYKVRVNNLQVDALYDTDVSIIVMAKWFYDRLQNKPKLTKCRRNISSASGEALMPIGECFIQLQIGKKIFSDRVIVIQNLNHNYIFGQMLCRTEIWHG